MKYNNFCLFFLSFPLKFDIIFRLFLICLKNDSSIVRGCLWFHLTLILIIYTVFFLHFISFLWHFSECDFKSKKITKTVFFSIQFKNSNDQTVNNKTKNYLIQGRIFILHSLWKKTYKMYNVLVDKLFVVVLFVLIWQRINVNPFEGQWILRLAQLLSSLFCLEDIFCGFQSGSFVNQSILFSK